MNSNNDLYTLLESFNDILAQIDELKSQYQEERRISNEEFNTKLEEYYTTLNSIVKILSSTEEFYDLPIERIIGVISRIDFSIIKNNYHIIKTFVKNTAKKHGKKANSLLNVLNIEKCNLTSEQSMKILEYFDDNPLLKNAMKMLNENPDVNLDYDYELEQRDKKIDELQKKIKEVTDASQQQQTQHPTQFPQSLSVNIPLSSQTHSNQKQYKPAFSPASSQVNSIPPLPPQRNQELLVISGIFLILLAAVILTE